MCRSELSFLMVFQVFWKSKEFICRWFIFYFDDMSKTYILWISLIIMHIETYHSRLITDAEELFVQSFPMLSKITLNAGVTLASNIFPFNVF